MDTKKSKITDLPLFSKKQFAWEEVEGGGTRWHPIISYCFFKSDNSKKIDFDYLCYKNIDNNLSSILKDA